MSFLFAVCSDAAGVEVTLVRHNGMIHEYGMLNYLSRIPVVRTALLNAAWSKNNDTFFHPVSPFCFCA